MHFLLTDYYTIIGVRSNLYLQIKMNPAKKGVEKISFELVSFTCCLETNKGANLTSSLINFLRVGVLL